MRLTFNNPSLDRPTDSQWLVIASIDSTWFDGCKSEVSLAEYACAALVKESFVAGLQVFRIMARARDLPLLQNAQSGYGAHSAFFSFGTGSKTVGT
jgi:hypothetical protein